MNTEKRIELKTHTMVSISEVLKNNLFALGEDAWTYTDDSGQLAMSITYAAEGNQVVFDVWMIDEEMQVLLDKIMDELEK